MKKSAIRFVALLLILGCLFCIGSAAAEEAAEAKATVLAKTGEVIQISAVGNPTTGYLWTEPVMSNGLTLISSEYTQMNPGMIGKGGIYEWWVTADKPGFYLFETEYKRPMSGTVAKDLQAILIILPDVLNVPSGLLSYYEI